MASKNVDLPQPFLPEIRVVGAVGRTTSVQ